MKFIRNHHIALSSPAHTLIEILVVVSIISILAAIGFGGAAAVIDAARKTDARNSAQQLQNGISAYYTEYRRYPIPHGISRKGDHVDLVTDEKLMEILLGARTDAAKRANPKGTRFLSPRTAKKLAANRYVNGVSLDQSGNGSGKLWDPWGRLYAVRIDLSSNEQLANPDHDKPVLSGQWAPEWGSGVSNQPKYISGSVIVWSSGKLEARSTDNIVTW